MTSLSPNARLRRVACRRALPGLVCALAASCLAQAPVASAGTEVAPSPSALAGTAATAAGQVGGSGAPAAKASATATLEQCVTAPIAGERSATFAGEMTAIPGTARMQMRIDVLERVPGEGQYRTVSAPGLGVWRGSAPGVKVYTYFNKVADLSAPAFYRGAVRFRWLNAKGRLIKAQELRTPRCQQPAEPSTAPATGTPSG